MLEQLRRLALANEDELALLLCSALLSARHTFPLNPNRKKLASQYLLRVLDDAVHLGEGDAPKLKHVLVTGSGLQALVEWQSVQGSLYSLWPAICNSSARYKHYALFWEGILSLMEDPNAAVEVDGPHMHNLKTSLLRCLAAPSRNLRLIALRVLRVIAERTVEQRRVLESALAIESTSLESSNVRGLSMHVRKLQDGYGNIAADAYIAEAIAWYCFGLLHCNLTVVWKDVCSALRRICQNQEGRRVVTHIAAEWIDATPDENAHVGHGRPSVTTFRSTEFECGNLSKLNEMTLRCLVPREDPHQELRSAFERRQARLPMVTSFNRPQALRVLSHIPDIAEATSRVLVPVLLGWVAHGADEPVTNESEADRSAEEPSDDTSRRWTRKDVKSVLEIVSKFVNPKALYQADQVYNALLTLLSNGDTEIQRSSLQALLAWKDPVVARYQEHLFRLLDDARFREEVIALVPLASEASQLQEDHFGRLLPVVLRLLYGRAISGKTGQEAKRRAVFSALQNFGNDALAQFLDISLGPLKGISVVEDDNPDEVVLRKALLSQRKQVGLLNMLQDMFRTLKTTLCPFTRDIVDPVLYCLISASRRLDSTSLSDGGQHNAVLKTIRQKALHCLVTLFENDPEFYWDPYVLVIEKEVVAPRLARLPSETAHSVAGLHRLFSAWAQSGHLAAMLVCDAQILPRLADGLVVPSAKAEVQVYVLNQILHSLLRLVGSDSDVLGAHQTFILAHVIKPHAIKLTTSIGDVLRRSPSKEVLEAGVRVLAELAPHVQDASGSRNIVEIAIFLLRQSSKRVSPATKQGLLKTAHAFLHRLGTDLQAELFEDVFEVVSSLFAFFRDTPSRSLLCKTIRAFEKLHPELEPITDLCDDLNSFLVSKLDEPDFDRRSRAFSTINDEKYATFSVVQWRPLVYNMLYYVRDNDELSIRVSASFALRRFAEVAKTNQACLDLLSTAVLPGIQSGMREASELIRVEFVKVLGCIVKSLPDWAPVADMRILLSNDEESSFFGNILHIQHHSRIRALRRLAANASHLASNSIYQMLLPMLEHFIFEKAADESASELAGETIKTIGLLADWLEWPQYRSLLRRYCSYMKTKVDMQRTMIKLVGSVLDSLHRSGRSANAAASDGMSGEANSSDKEDGDVMEIDSAGSTLTSTLPRRAKMTQDLTENILPLLTEFLHNKDEGLASLRVLTAIAAVKVIQILPSEEIRLRLPRVLLDICHILKSRSQDARDMARNTLTEIATLLGAEYLGFIVKSLRGPLKRGYQLHVLSFTVHHILVELSPQLEPGDLDYCLSDIVAVIMDDIFGAAGQEKDAEGYTNQMREVKGSKSFDSMERVARVASVSHLTDLVRPIQALLREKLPRRMAKKAEELLRRIGQGVLQNATSEREAILDFCYELLQKDKRTNRNERADASVDSRMKRFLVNTKGAAKSGTRYTAGAHVFLITRFSLDLLRVVLRKHEELRAPPHIARLLPMISEALVGGPEDVQISAVRLARTIIKTPLAQLDEDCSVYVAEAVATIDGAQCTKTELAQASLKMVSAVLRERPKVVIDDQDLTRLIDRVLPDLDELDRQGATFEFFEALLSRRVTIPEVYEAMQEIAKMMVISHARSTRDMARKHYFRFLMEYPQTRTHFTNQVEFLVRNVGYEHVEGRQSVMETCHLMLSKVDDAVLENDHKKQMWTMLTSAMSSDTSSECRAMARALIKDLFRRADGPLMNHFIGKMRKWIKTEEIPAVKRVGLHCWGLLFEATEGKTQETPLVLRQLTELIEKALMRDDPGAWIIVYTALTVLSTVCAWSPETVLAWTAKDVWSAVEHCVSYPHTWVKTGACELFGKHFADLLGANGGEKLAMRPLAGSHGLRLTDKSMLWLADRFLKNLRIAGVHQNLYEQSVRNLGFLSRCFAVNSLIWDWRIVAARFEDEVEYEQAIHDNALDVEDEEAVLVNGEDESSEQPTALHHVLMRLCAIVRGETNIMKPSALHAKTAVMKLLQALCTQLPTAALTPSLPQLLITLQTLIDPATTVPHAANADFNNAYAALVTKGREIVATLQERLETPKYLALMLDVQKSIRGRRHARKVKRRIEAVSMPEKHGKEKQRRHQVKKVKRREKNAAARARRTKS